MFPRGEARPGLSRIIARPSSTGFAWPSGWRATGFAACSFVRSGSAPPFTSRRSGLWRIPVHVTDRAVFEPYRCGVAILARIARGGRRVLSLACEPYRIRVSGPAGHRVSSSTGSDALCDRHRRWLVAWPSWRRLGCRPSVASRAAAVPSCCICRSGHCALGFFSPVSRWARFEVGSRYAGWQSSAAASIRRMSGNQLVALYVLETAAVDELWFVPCWKHPFDKALEAFADRLRMCELAAAALGSARARQRRRGSVGRGGEPDLADHQGPAGAPSGA